MLITGIITTLSHPEIAGDKRIYRHLSGLFLRANQISHRLHVHRVTGEIEATEIPPVLDCREHRIVVVSHARSACGMVGVGDGYHHNTTAALASRSIAAARVVAKPLKAGTGKIAFIPSNEDD